MHALVGAMVSLNIICCSFTTYIPPLCRDPLTLQNNLAERLGVAYMTVPTET